MDIVPTFKTRNERMCLLLPDGRLGYLLTRDAERLQARAARHWVLRRAINPKP